MARKYIDNPNACSLVHTMNIIGNKWKPIILYLLSNGSMRFGMLNALIPTVTLLGLLVGGLLSGAVLTETIFAWPGVGRFAVQSIMLLDRLAVVNVTILVGIVFSTANLTVDILVAFLDPRIRY